MTALAGIGAAVPVIVACARALGGGWMPLGDQGTIATRAYEVLGPHSPLLGQYSFVSRVVGHTTFDAGPLLYWLLALPARFGGPVALTVTMGTVNSAAIIASVAIARRRGGIGLMVATAVCLALLSRSFATEAIDGIWNPAAALLPLTLLIFACWSLACGEHRLLPLVALLASFVVQCHLAYVAPSAAALAVGFGGLALSLKSARSRSLRERPMGREPSARPSPRHWALAALAVLLVCWSAPLAQQLTTSPGNLSLLARAATASHAQIAGATAGWRALTQAIGIVPRWLRSPQDLVTSPSGRAVGSMSGGDYGDTRLSDIWSVPSPLRTTSSALVLLALALAAYGGLRRGRSELVAGTIIALVLCMCFAWQGAATPRSSIDTLGYTLWWGSIVGMWTWLVLGYAASVLVVRQLAMRLGFSRIVHRRARRTGHLAGGVILLIGCSAVAAAQPPDAHRSEYALLHTIMRAIARRIPPGATVTLRREGVTAAPFEAGVKYALQLRGARVLEPANEADPARASGAYALVLADADTRAPDRLGTVIARLRLHGAPWLPGGSGSHTLTVSLRAPPAG
ncbi:MAG TPA: hypothetical protein VKU89_10835 [Solirubrobacteraceae bacterium]|nr:hypothetical protein [Solirubrobacteraceae bacterium]